MKCLRTSKPRLVLVSGRELVTALIPEVTDLDKFITQLDGGVNHYLNVYEEEATCRPLG